MLTKPLTIDQILVKQDEDGYITETIEFSLSELIDHDIEGLNDLAEERMVEQGILADISYKVVGHITPQQGEGSVLIEVTAEVDLTSLLEAEGE